MVMKFDSYSALMINRGNRILILFHSYCCSKNTLSPGGVLKKCLYRKALPRGPTPYLLYTIFYKKGTSFVYLLFTNGSPYTHLV